MFSKLFCAKAVETGVGALVVGATGLLMASGEVERMQEMKPMEAENPGHKAVQTYNSYGSYGYFTLKLVPETKEEDVFSLKNGS